MNLAWASPFKMRKFRKQNEQVYISSYDYHIVSIWQFDCCINI